MFPSTAVLGPEPYPLQLLIFIKLLEVMFSGAVTRVFIGNWSTVSQV